MNRSETNITMAMAPNISSVDGVPDPPRDPTDYDDVVFLNIDNLLSVMQPWTEDDAFLPTIITYAITFFLGIIGNTTVVLALLLDRKDRHVTSFFLISLSVADLAFLVICVPYEVLLRSDVTWAGGAALCKFVEFVEMLSASASVMNLMAVSIERYIVIVHPMKSRSWCTIGNTKKIIVAVWVVATLLSSPNLHIMDARSSLYYNNVTYVVTVSCMEYNVTDVEWLVFAYYQLVVLFIIPVVILLYCYSVVIEVLWSSAKGLALMTNTNQTRKICAPTENSRHRLQISQHSKPGLVARGVKDNTMEARKQVIKMLLAIIAAFFVCWGPKLVLHALKRHELEILHSNSAYITGLVINILPFIHSCLNPFIYGFMSKNFRRNLRTKCSNRCLSAIHRYGSKRPNSLEFDMDSKSMNGISRYSSTISRGTLKTNYTSVALDSYIK